MVLDCTIRGVHSDHNTYDLDHHIVQKSSFWRDLVQIFNVPRNYFQYTPDEGSKSLCGFPNLFIVFCCTDIGVTQSTKYKWTLNKMLNFHLVNKNKHVILTPRKSRQLWIHQTGEERTPLASQAFFARLPWRIVRDLSKPQEDI